MSFEFTLRLSHGNRSSLNVTVSLVKRRACLSPNSNALGAPCTPARCGSLNYGKNSIVRETIPWASTSRRCGLSYVSSCRRVLRERYWTRGTPHPVWGTGFTVQPPPVGVLSFRGERLHRFWAFILFNMNIISCMFHYGRVVSPSSSFTFSNVLSLFLNKKSK